MMPGTRHKAQVSTHASKMSISDDVKPKTRDKNIIWTWKELDNENDYSIAQVTFHI